MMKRLSSLIFASLLIILSGIGAALAEIRDPEEHFFHQTFGDLQEEVELALEEGQKGNHGHV